jgi:hypothetical protein
LPEDTWSTFVTRGETSGRSRITPIKRPVAPKDDMTEGRAGGQDDRVFTASMGTSRVAQQRARRSAKIDDIVRMKLALARERPLAAWDRPNDRAHPPSSGGGDRTHKPFG